MTKIVEQIEKISQGVTGGYKKIEDGVVGGYKKILTSRKKKFAPEILKLSENLMQ